MPLVSGDTILRHARENGYAVCAINIENMEMVQAVIEAAEEKNSPVIIQTSANTVKYASMTMFYAMVRAAVENSPVPVALHLDHGDSRDLALKAIQAGYTSVMIDASKQSFEENIRQTTEVVEICKPVGVSIESELGTVGGKPGDIEYGADGYTKVEEATEFVERTGVTSLAVAIGTVHGVYKGEPNLDLELLKNLRSKVNVPLVLHGASGLSEQDIKHCVEFGISKINYATELRIAFSDAVKEYITSHDNIIDPKLFTKHARQTVKQVVIEKMHLCGSSDQVKQTTWWKPQ